MKHKKTIIASVVLLLVLVSFRIIWIEKNTSAGTMKVQNGVLDMRGTAILQETLYPLSGKWAFYENEFIEPGSKPTGKPVFIDVPGSWKDQLAVKSSPHGFGTYYARILVDPLEEEFYRLHVRDIVASSAIFIQYEKASQLGRPAEMKSKELVDYRPQTVRIDGDTEEITIFIHVSNFHALNGGIIQPIKLGGWEAAEKEVFKEYAWQLILAAYILLHGLYAFCLYVCFTRSTHTFYIALFFFLSALTIMLSDDKLFLYFIPAVSFHTWKVLTYASYVSAVYFLVLFMKTLMQSGGAVFGKLFTLHWRLTTVLYIGYIAGILLPFRPNVFVHVLVILFMLSTLFFLIYRMSASEKKSNVWLVLSMISLLSNVLWSAFKMYEMPHLPYYPFDMLFSTMFFGIFWIHRFLAEKERSKTLALSLQREVQWKDEFLARASHELRNPLHSMLNISQILIDNEAKQAMENSKKNLETLLSAGRRMSVILDDLIDREQMDSEQLRLEKKEIELLPVVEMVFDMLKFMKEEKRIVLKHSIAKDFPLLSADENRLHQVLFNLVHNALKFSDGGNITITAKAEEQCAVITVADEGIGMDAETAASIFDAYVQGSGESGGRGLGLSICRQLVMLHGGRIDVETEEGSGSAFTFTIPLAFSQTRQLTAEQTQAVGGTVLAGRVLAVDDDVMNLEVITQVLQSEGYEVATCTNGQEALGRLHDNVWNLVIADVRMPQMSGYELTAEIRKTHSLAELPVLLLTACTKVQDVQKGFEAGANDYVRKPVEKYELLARVNSLTALNNAVTEHVQMEAAWLQAQIQPHFVFNTLNTISALSEIDSEKMIKLLNQFGNYLQQSFTAENLQQTVPLYKELELVKSFIYIEQQRYGSRLAVEFDITAPLQLEVPPLSIQTLVENAVEHGVLKRPEGGTVRITIAEEGERVKVEIADNGVGMTEEAIAKAFCDDKEETGIGLQNTNKRLLKCLGSSLEIDSTLHVGTTVMFYIEK